jgi:hypothetical protein
VGRVKTKVGFLNGLGYFRLQVKGIQNQKVMCYLCCAGCCRVRWL